MAVFFNGRLLVTPAVASRVDDTEMANQNLSVPMNLAVMGRADSGEPKRVFDIGNPVEAEEIFKGGELLTAIRKAFAPSAQTNGPQVIKAVRVDPALQARLVAPQEVDTEETGALQALPETADETIQVKLAGAASATDDYYNGYRILMTSGVAFGETNLIEDYDGATRVATCRYAWRNTPAAADAYELIPAAFCLESTDYGVNANRVKIKVADGTTSGTKKASTGFANDTVYRDNLAATYFTLGYSGSAASCIVDIDASSLTVKAGTPGSETTLYVADLSVYNTVSKLVDFLDSKPDLDAVYTPAYRDYPTYGKLDFVTGKKIDRVCVRGTADAASDTTHLTLSQGSDVDDAYNAMTVVFTSGALAGVSTTISDYTGSTRTATLSDTLSEAPDAMAYKILATTVSGTAQAGGANSITLESWENASDDYYNGYRIEITGGTGSGQARRITGYVGSTKTATVNRSWRTQPDTTSVYEITEDHNITADLQAILDWIDGAGEPYISTYRPPQSGVVADNFDWTFLHGGTASTPTVSDWQDCFDILQTEDIQCLVPLSSNSAIHAMSDAHCQYMSNAGGMERRCIVGGALGEDIDSAVARAYALNSDRTYLCAPGYRDYDGDGALTDYAPYMLAALMGGMVCGQDPGESLTNKTITVRGVEQKWRIPTDTDELIDGGVIAVCPTRQGYKVIRSVSTWLVNDNYNRVEMGTGFATDYVTRSVRGALQDLVGRKGTSLTVGRAVSVTESILKELSRSAPMGPEVITGDSQNPAYKNITAELSGDVLRVWFQCSPVVPVNYVLCSVAVKPYSGSSSQTATTTL